MEFIQIPVIKPNYTAENLKNCSKTGAIYYPQAIFKCQISIKRIFMEERKAKVIVTIDTFRQLKSRSDIFPEIMEQKVAKEYIMPTLMERNKTRNMAKRYAFVRAVSRYASLYTPQVDIIREEYAYKIFWLINENKNKKLRAIDSINNNSYIIDKDKICFK